MDGIAGYAKAGTSWEMPFRYRFSNEFLSPLPEDFSGFLTASMKLNAEQVEKLVIKADEEFRASLLAN